MRSREPSLQQATTTRWPLFSSEATWATTASKTLTSSRRPLGGEAAAVATAEIDDGRALRLREGREPGERMGDERLVPLGPGEVERIGRERLVGSAAPRLPRFEHVAARCVVVGDLVEALARPPRRRDGRSPAGRRRRGSKSVSRLGKKSGSQCSMPMIAAAFADRLVEQVVAVGDAEKLDVAAAEQGDRLRRKLEFVGRDEIDALPRRRRFAGCRGRNRGSIRAYRRRNRGGPATRSRRRRGRGCRPAPRTRRVRERWRCGETRWPPASGRGRRGRGGCRRRRRASRARRNCGVERAGGRR